MAGSNHFYSNGITSCYWCLVSIFSCAREEKEKEIILTLLGWNPFGFV